MRKIVPEVIERYCTENTTPESPLLRELVAETYARTAFPEMQVGHLEGALLRMLVRLIRAKRVLELGTFTGYSSLVMAEGLPEDGKLITCDIDPQVTEIAKKYWSRSPHGKKIELRLGYALETLKTIEGPFDLVFIDADKENYVNYWESCMPKTRSGGLLVVDNVLWSGDVLDPKDRTDRAIAEFNRHVRNDKRVEIVMLPVRDGITLAWKF
ncbi:MAG: class I SAM-dependent methyltransferase [Candidatus Methanoperedens sp.]|nr:class I SAM-dependent methyltransferase [Candidatus Methanoperedens sp.]